MVGNLGQLAFERSDGRKIVGLANQVQRAQSLPDLVDPGIQGRDFVSRRTGLPGLRK